MAKAEALMARRYFFKSKSLRKYKRPGKHVEAVMTRIPCNQTNNEAVAKAAKAAAKNSPCEASRFCRPGRNTDEENIGVVVSCYGGDELENLKDRLFRRLDKMRRERRVSMSGRKRRR
jgi:hypothetical protein